MLSPLSGQVVIRPSKAEEVSKGGVIIPETAHEKPAEGEVVAVAPSVTEVEVGDTVLYSRYAATEVAFDGDKLLFIPERDVLAKVG